MDDPLKYLFAKPPTPMSVLKLDAMYYHAALQCFEKARAAEPPIAEARHEFKELNAESERVLEKYDGDPHRGYSELEPLYIRLTGACERIGFAYAPAIEGLGLTHVLCAAALESHINSRAQELLEGRLRHGFDETNLEFKWLSLPRLLGNVGFEPGKEPFQSFHVLVQFRNRLMHYKERREEWVDPGVPTFLENLGLTRELADKSLRATAAMVSELAKQLGQEQPHWLRREPGEMNYFEYCLVD